MHKVLVNCLGGLPRNNVDRLIDHTRNDLKKCRRAIKHQLNSTKNGAGPEDQTCNLLITSRMPHPTDLADPAYCNHSKCMERQVMGKQCTPKTRLLLKDQSDHGLDCLPFRLHLLDTFFYGKTTLLKF